MRILGPPGGTGKFFLLAAGLLLAHQVAGKAVRDGLFLSRFPPADLPKVVAAAALAAVLLGLVASRLMARMGPRRLVSAGLTFGAALHVVEFLLLRGAGENLRGVVITVVYLHLVGFGAILLSGFWSIVNEFYDPREAKQQFGRIAGAGTAGGVAGGLLAERCAALAGVEWLLILLAGIYLAAAATLSQVAADRRGAEQPDERGSGWEAARDAFREAPFLVNVALLVLLGTVSAALLDYLFKSSATMAFGKGLALTRYFALFYATSHVLSFIVQTCLTPAVLRNQGLGRTVGWHPAAVAVGAGASLLGPTLLMLPLARGLELVLRGSFLRSGYELFFTPVPPREKRAVKTFIDVGCDRLGDAAGAGILQLLLLLGPAVAVKPILVVTIGLALISLRIASRMDSAYSGVLELGLMRRAVAVEGADVEDSTTLSALMHTRFLAPVAAPMESGSAKAPKKATPVEQDRLLARLADLRSGSTSRVEPALAPTESFDPLVASQAIRLLAWNEVTEAARAFLLLHAHRMVGQLVDALLDPEQDFAVRRRIPRILAYTSSQKAVDGLLGALEDSRFEIRYHASRALEFLHRMGGELQFPTGMMMAAVERELSTARPIWEARRLLDSRNEDDELYWFLDEVLKDRAIKSLEHVFSLLALQLPGEPLRVAFRALHSDDRMLRGLALEYLESNVPGTMVSRLAELMEPDGTVTQPRPREEVLADLMRSQQSILASLKIPSGDAPGQAGLPQTAT